MPLSLRNERRRDQPKADQSEGLRTMELNIPSDTVSEFAETIKETSGLDINVCYQCKKCTSGCPISYAMDYTDPIDTRYPFRAKGTSVK